MGRRKKALTGSQAMKARGKVQVIVWLNAAELEILDLVRRWQSRQNWLIDAIHTRGRDELERLKLVDKVKEVG